MTYINKNGTLDVHVTIDDRRLTTFLVNVHKYIKCCDYFKNDEADFIQNKFFYGCEYSNVF